MQPITRAILISSLLSALLHQSLRAASGAKSDAGEIDTLISLSDKSRSGFFPIDQTGYAASSRHLNRIDVGDYAPDGHPAGQALLAFVKASQGMAGDEVTVAGARTIQLGAYVAQLAIPEGTHIVAMRQAYGNGIVVTLSSPTRRPVREGEVLMIGPTDDTPAFAGAIKASKMLSSGNVIFVPSGNYIIAAGALPATSGWTTWEIDPGAAIYGAEIPGFWGKRGFATGHQGLALGRNDVSADNSNMLYLSQDIGDTEASGPVEKNVLDVDCSDGDSTGYADARDPARGLRANANTACIGYHAEVRLGNDIHGGTIWASQYNVRIPAGTDGYAVALEYGLENGGTYSPEIGSGYPKVGIKAICSGPQDCTTANEYEAAGAAFHMFERFYQPALRTDGWAWMYEAVGYVPLADVDYQGNLYAQTLRAADVGVASLPRDCRAGEIVHATDGRKPDESVGQGSGVDVECELVGKGARRTGWYSMMGGYPVRR